MKRFTILVTIIWLLSSICSPAALAGEQMSVYVSLLPQKFFVKSVGGNLVNVYVMVAPGANPHDYEPRPSQMKTLASAKIYFTIGAPFEDAWLDKLTSVNPKIKIIHTEDGIEKKPMSHHDSLKDNQLKILNKSRHGHGINDPHIWLSPPLVMLQARNILTGLIDEMPQHRKEFETNYKRFIDQLVALDTEFQNEFKHDQNKEFLVLHPSWGYFADAYQLRQVSIEVEGKEAKAKDLKTLIEYARKQGIRTIFVQPQFSTKQAQMIASDINGRIITADPLAENWMENLKAVASSIKKALR